MYYLGKNGQQTGPFTLEQLRGMAAGGLIAPTDLLWTEGMSGWQPANTVPGIFAAQNAGVPPLAGGPPPQPAPGVPGAPATRVPSYLWQSIGLTLCCCLPFGIVAIVYSAQVNSKLAAGDIAGAVGASAKARMWCWVALVVGVLVNIASIPKLIEVTRQLQQSSF